VNKSVIGTNAKVTIENEAGEKIKYSDDTKKLTKNEVTIDGTTFKFNGTTGIEGVTLTGKVDGTELKDKIVEFINDYNELLGHINGKLYEEYDRSYLPLTDEDKEGLSDSEIEKLEKKAQTGLLRNDSYLRNFVDDMKLTMTTILEGSGLSLEKIGINPVKDYSAQNGLFTIDEDKLLAAIEEDPDGIKELFAGKNGIVTKLKDNLSEHATGTFSRLANKAGVANGVTANTNEMTKDIEQRKKQIANMQTMLKEKEDALYIRYSSLESSLASLQSQQSSLSSYFQ
jgi:flagellar hook-associated protein 2